MARFKSPLNPHAGRTSFDSDPPHVPTKPNFNESLDMKMFELRLELEPEAMFAAAMLTHLIG